MARHLHSKGVLQQLGQEVDLFPDDRLGVFDEVGLIPIVVIGKRLEWRRIPGVEVHADFPRPSSQNVAREFLKVRRLRHFVIGQVGRFQLVSLAESLKSPKKRRVAGCDLPRASPEIVSLRIECDQETGLAGLWWSQAHSRLPSGTCAA